MVDDSTGPEDIGILKQRIDCVRYWLGSFAPDEVKFSVCKVMPECELTEEERSFLGGLSVALADVEWKGENIHDVMYEHAKSCGLGAKEGSRPSIKSSAAQNRALAWDSSCPR